MEPQDLMSAKGARIHAITLIAISMIFVDARKSCAADNHRTPEKLDRGAIAQFIDGRFELIHLSGRLREFEDRSHYFTSSRFSSDGQAIVGLMGLQLVVLNQNFETLWKIRPSNPNIWRLALSPSRTQVAFISLVSGSKFALGIVDASGKEQHLANLDRGDNDGSWGLSWSPESDRLVYGRNGEVKIIDVVARSSLTVGEGFEPTWSPDGKWIAYRRRDGRAELYNLARRVPVLLAGGVKITSSVHWAQDSEHVMVVEHSQEKTLSKAACPLETRFIVYGPTDRSRKEIFITCMLRDWSFDWISDPAKWISSVKRVN
jgi:hypothetical protein